MLTTRQQKVLSQLIEKESFVSINFFTEMFNLSPRTLRHDLLMIEEWLIETGRYITA